jgi:hypothetical protein
MNKLSGVVAFAIATLVGAPSQPHAQATQEPLPTLGTPADRSTAPASTPVDNLELITGWFCPMHPAHTSHEAGKCPICGMALIPGDPYDTADYVLDVTTSPAAVASGMPFTMIFKVRHPGTGDAVKSYEVVHDKRYHLFVISQDLTVFQHLHPELQADGSWELGLTLPKPGYYRVLSDFLPSGGSPQFLGRTLVTTDFEEDLESQAAHLEPDAVLTKTVESITASVELEPSKLIAGQYGHLRFMLTDAATGEPITDLQPYLGAFGHTLILSEDMLDYVHSHPSAGPDNDISKGFGGPRVTFEGYMPRPGLYRAWTQFLRKDHLTTVSFTFSVLTLEDAVRTQQ